MKLPLIGRRYLLKQIKGHILERQENDLGDKPDYNEALSFVVDLL